MKARLLFFFYASLCTFACQTIQEDIISPSVRDCLKNKDNFVSAQNVKDYLSDKIATKGINATSYSLETYSDVNNNPLLYIVNYDSGGWQILSSDRRTPAILAESDKGRFSMDEGSEGLKIWMACMAENIACVRNSPDEALVFSPEEIAHNKRFWGKEDPSRALFPPETPVGRWYTHTESVTEVVDSIPHITVTQWDQNLPYNYYCPYKTNGTDKSPAGCVAISGAQMLYFLHSKYGKPQAICDSAYCVGNINCFYREFYQVTDSAWTLMSPSHSNAFWPITESAMIGYIGSLVSMDYGDNGSSASTSDLVSNVFNFFGYNCSYDSYSESIVKNSLLDGNPVVASAHTSWVPLFGDGHSFIIDGYKRTRIHTTVLHYYLIGDENEGYSDPNYPDYYTESYTNPEITSIKMNWGWGNQWDLLDPVNDGWFTLTDGWVVTVNGEQSNYQYRKHLIHNFSLSASL